MTQFPFLKILVSGCMCAMPFLLNAAEVRYFQNVGISGLLSERTVTDCCNNGKEERITIPVIELRNAIDVLPINTLKPVADEMPELGVKTIQLVMDDESWKIYKLNKKKNARVLCSLFHGFNGHHHTAVLCTVKSLQIAKD